MLRFSQHDREGGFSLIEVAIGLLILSLLLTPVLYSYNQFMVGRRVSDTRAAEDVINSALIKYVAKYGHYPYPSDPNIVVEAANFGQQAVKPGAGWPACTATSLVTCRTTTNVYGGHAVLIGAVPFAAIGVPYRATLDGYGMKMTYAVTEDLTSTATYNEGGGGIEVLNIGGASIYGGTIPRSHFAVVSHGEDRLGATNLGGTRTFACGVAAGGTDFENCNNDGTFRSNYDGTVGRMVQLYGTGAQHFDDFVMTSNKASTGIWSFIPNSPSMRTYNNGNVYIGNCPNSPCVPKAHLDVRGDVRANRVLMQRLCYRDGVNCTTATSAGGSYIAGYSPPYYLSPDFLVGAPAAGSLPDNANKNALYIWDSGTQSHRGAGISCVGDRGLWGTFNWTEYCNYTSYFKNTVNINSCSSGYFPSGVDATGKLICVLP